ncbi:MAG: hypothetical protein ED555_08165 [Allomuricauda sp.]|nr:MAG: hypothetical protein ED555_08165 [Allomuricauda sp.]
MTTFLTILFVLLAGNATLLIFGTKGFKTSVKKPLQDMAKASDINLFEGQYQETEYKEAV